MDTGLGFQSQQLFESFCHQTKSHTQGIAVSKVKKHNRVDLSELFRDVSFA